MSRLPAPSAIATCLLTLVLSACSTQQPLPASGVQPERFEYISQQTVPADQTPEQVAQSLGGKVAFWHEGSRTVVVGFDASVKILKQSSALIEQNPQQFKLPESPSLLNLGKIWSIGSLWELGKIWAIDDAWNLERSWNNQQYMPIPENSPVWNALELEMGQKNATALGTGVTIAVLDTGVDFTHAAWNPQVFASPDLHKDYVDNDNVPQEFGTFDQNGYGHGTGVTGIILQIAPKAKILPLRVLNPDGVGDTVVLASAIYQAVDSGARIINLSLGSDQPSTVVENAIRYAESHQVVIVASAGNNNKNELLYPAAYSEKYKNVISVGSVNVNLFKSSFSNYNQFLTVTGIGENIISTAPENFAGKWSGTSFSAPEVSGAVALALSMAPGLDAEKTVRFLKNSATNNYAINPNYRYLLGSGTLNINRLINIVRANK